MIQASSQKRNTIISPTWCPGCGNFGIITALNQAADDLGLSPEQLAIVYDIGCSGNMADFVFSYGFHGLHGRTLPVAAGIKIANHKLAVISIIGDGGCYGEGISHFIGLSRGNHDILVISHNNYRYSLTTGQTSPTSPQGTKTPSTPFGSIESPVDPLTTAINNQATFVARGFAGDVPHLSKLIQAGINHQGFAVIDVLQPCVTYNREMTQQWYHDHIAYLDKIEYQPNQRRSALDKIQEKEKLFIGIFFQQDKPCYHQLCNPSTTPLTEQSISSINIDSLLKEFA